MTEVFQKITELFGHLHGWTSIEKGHALAALVLALRPEISIDVGVYGGKSTFALALAHKFLGKGQVWAIDPWSVEASIEGMKGDNLRWWKNDARHEIVYADFMRQVDLTATGNVIVVKRSKSDDVEPPKELQLFHCDGNHSVQAVRDVERYASRISCGGICILDDLDWEHGGVRKAEKKLLSMGFKQLYLLGTGAVYQQQK